MKLSLGMIAAMTLLATIMGVTFHYLWQGFGSRVERHDYGSNR